MNTAQKIAQMTQPHLATPSSNWGGNSSSNDGTVLWGSVLNGGDGYSSVFLQNMTTALNTWPADRGPRIPTYYGKDAVHGNAGVPGYTVFPHNIGLGATRDSALVRRIGEATAIEMWAAGIDLNFSPAISVARDARWGRTYESYGENPELHVQMGAAMVRGLQGARWDAPWRVTATAKHFLADGGTTGGVDRGNSTETDEELRAIHLPGYEAVVEQGVLSVMASFNTIHGVHQHVDSLRMTGWLKTELGFDGYIISDWLGITNSEHHGYTGDDYAMGTTPPPTMEAIRRAINAGVDLAMEPGTHGTFIQRLTTLVNNGDVSMERIDDAVRRILRAKFRAGRMDLVGGNFVAGPAGYFGNTANRASAEHRAIAREAVVKSQVLLKNENDVLPLAKNANIHVFGPHHDNIGRQCGGWTITWRGVNNNTDFAGVGTSILQGMRQVSGQSTFTTAANADVIVYVTGENPYAEWYGDIPTLNFPAHSNTDSAALASHAADMAALANYRDQGKTIVTIFVTGRPRIVPALIEASDAFLVAWLPGTEGAGVADILFGDQPLTGKLPFTWPGSGGTTQFPYGFGLDYLDTPDAPGAPTLVSKTHNSVTLEPNSDYEFSMDGTTWQTDNVFTDLTPETEYTFYQRVAATENSHPSEPSLSLNVTTDEYTSIAEIERKDPTPQNELENSALIRPAGTITNEFTVGPNPVFRHPTSGVAYFMEFFWQGTAIKDATFSIYNATGTFINRVKISDTSTGSLEKRHVGDWDLMDSRGRSVPAGSYVVVGTITTRDGRKERVSVVLGVR
jgi:beta-glucosidase